MSKHYTKSSFRYNPMTGVCYRNLGFLGFPRYRVGDDSSVWRWVASQKVWKRRQEIYCKGYARVTLCRPGVKKIVQLHRLVLFAFVGPCPEGMVCRHFPDRTPANCRLENLSWSTQTVNLKDREIHKTKLFGSKSPWAKLNEKIVLKARRLHKTGKFSYTDLAKLFGVTRITISRAVKGEMAWRHV